MKDSVKRMFLKTRQILTKACKGIQYFEKLYTAITKALLLKLILYRFLVPLIKISNFSNNYILVHIIIYWKKVPPGLTVINFRKCSKALLNDCFSNHHRKELLCSFLLKSGITKNSLFVVTRRFAVYQSC